MNTITMIPVGLLEHHPENPRKDLGDLTELTASIRKNGIMQNLTVVPDMDNSKYLVVIGNRRLEAAKAAGLIELPCVVKDLDHKTQIATMLEENMQRADLTIYEQAQGFQMMMDLGYSAADIAEKTGFGETTVRRRIKMAEMDAKLLKKACEGNDTDRQITLLDFDRLAQVEDISERNKLLECIGESNFEWKLNRTLKVQQARKMKDAAHKAIQEAKLKKVPDGELYCGKYRQLYCSNCELDKWDGKKPFIPKNADGELFYTEDETDIYFYIKEKKQPAKPEKKSPAQIEKEKQIDLAWKTVERVATESAELRARFVEGLTVGPKNCMRMMQWAMIAAFGAMLSYDTPSLALVKRFNMQQMNIPDRIEKMSQTLLEMPQKQWPNLILLMFQGEKEPKTLSFTCGGRYDFPQYDKKVRLELCYSWLTEFGYQMSDEEIQMMAGTHEVYKKGGKA